MFGLGNCLVHPGICLGNWAERNRNGPLGGLVYFCILHFVCFPHCLYILYKDTICLVLKQS